MELNSLSSVWVCTACGKTSKDKYGKAPLSRGWDVSCMLNAVECLPESLVFNDSGLVVRAEAVGLR